jgi:hypothetical protein
MTAEQLREAEIRRLNDELARGFAAIRESLVESPRHDAECHRRALGRHHGRLGRASARGSGPARDQADADHPSGQTRCNFERSLVVWSKQKIPFRPGLIGSVNGAS